jgi:hypothetical protein
MAPRRKNRLESITDLSTPAETRSEHYLQTQLQIPWIERLGRPPKLRAPHVANRVVQIDAVKQVEGVGLELDIEPITRLDVLE